MSDAVAAFVHRTVLLHETVAALQPRSGGVYADATLGGGGHAEAILEASSPDGVIIGVDRDENALAAARHRLSRFGSRARFVHAPFSQLSSALRQAGFDSVDGIVADLGVSSPQLDHADRGFSFSRPGPLDMRMDASRGPTVFEFMQDQTENELADVIYQYGEERLSRRIARVIKEALAADELHTTEDLRAAVNRAVGGRRGQKTDPATRTFQALRIAVNDELGELKQLLLELPDLLRPEGVAAVISFHSLEDRIVKHAFRGDDRLEPCTKKPVIPTDAEANENPRARSAKLRAARKVIQLESTTEGER